MNESGLASTILRLLRMNDGILFLSLTSPASYSRKLPGSLVIVELEFAFEHPDTVVDRTIKYDRHVCRP